MKVAIGRSPVGRNDGLEFTGFCAGEILNDRLEVGLRIHSMIAGADETCVAQWRLHFPLYSHPHPVPLSRRMSSLPTADLLALDTPALKSRLSKLRRYL